MILAAAWLDAEHCGLWTPEGNGLRQRAPALTATEEVTALIGGPVRSFPRMTADAQRCVCAAGLALRGARWRERLPATEIGVLAAGYEAYLDAHGEYFGDYVASGRKLGRASLFVYTLPTSAACAVSMALGLTGPVLHIHEEAPGGEYDALARRAAQMAAEGEAQGMLALWSDRRAAVCLAVGAGDGIGYPAAFQALRAASPRQLARELQAMPAL
jgi:hypothetical protein